MIKIFSKRTILFLNLFKPLFFAKRGRPPPQRQGEKKGPEFPGPAFLPASSGAGGGPGKTQPQKRGNRGFRPGEGGLGRVGESMLVPRRRGLRGLACRPRALLSEKGDACFRKSLGAPWVSGEPRLGMAGVFRVTPGMEKTALGVDNGAPPRPARPPGNAWKGAWVVGGPPKRLHARNYPGAPGGDWRGPPFGRGLERYGYPCSADF